jgi:manganese oxidase
MKTRAACTLPLIVLLASCAMDVQPGVNSQTRVYYIAADEMPWDYVPGSYDGIMGKPFKAIGYFKTPKNPYTEKEVSTKYKKVLYREYTDSTFKTLKPRPPEWEHLGFLGPIVRGVVGDTIRIVFRNNGSSRTRCIHTACFTTRIPKARCTTTAQRATTRATTL